MEIKADIIDKPRVYRRYGTGSRKWARPRLFISIKGESVWEGFINREARPVDTYRRLLPRIFAELGLSPRTAARWSQRAGCSCPCSPGFILTSMDNTNIDYSTVITATVAELEDLKRTGPVDPRRVAAMMRVQQEIAAGKEERGDL